MEKKTKNLITAKDETKETAVEKSHGGEDTGSTITLLTTPATGANGAGKIMITGKPVVTHKLEGKKATPGVVDIPCVVVTD